MSDTHVTTHPGAGAWVLGIFMGVLGLLGLVVASATHDNGLYVIGLLVFFGNILCIFILIGRFVGRHGAHAPDEMNS